MTLDQVWEELNRLVLVGAEQQPLSDELRAALEEWQLSNEGSQTEIVLEGLAAIQVMRRAAFKLSSRRSWPEDVAPKEEKEVCGRRSVYHLELILDGEFMAALPEFTEYLKEQGKLLPPELLAPLLDRCQLEPDLYDSIKPLLGQRGAWLLQQNPVWQRLDPLMVDVAHWPKLALEEKKIFLRHYRQKDATAARSFLADQWEALDKKEQEKLLPVLATALEPADEIWLNQRLFDKRKALRESAAALLCRLEDSALSQRLFQRTTEVWRFGAKRMQLHLPEEIPSISFADGIPTKAHKQYGGLKMSWLGHHLERIPPTRWIDHFNRSADEILLTVGKSREAEPLLYALSGAALRFEDEAWQAAIIRYTLAHQQANQKATDRQKELFQTLSVTHLQAMPMNLLQFGGDGGWRDHSAVQLLLQNPNPWGEKLSLFVLQQMQKAAGRSSGPPDLRPLFEQAAYKAEPSILRKAKTGWPTLEGDGGYFPWALQKFLRTLTFRREMREAMK